MHKKLIALTVLLIALPLQAQTAKRDPHIGYLYPAGGQTGTTMQIIAGGQFLNGHKEAFISGSGVQCKIIRHTRMFNLNGDRKKLLTEKLTNARNKKLIQAGADPELLTRNNNPNRPRKNPPAKKAPPKSADKQTPEKKQTPPNQNKNKAVVKLPQHPLLDDLENKTLRQLAHVRETFFFPRSKLQQNRQLAELVVIELIISPDAKPGNRELRILTNLGLTNPMVFQIGTLAETRELEPNNKMAYPDYLKTLRVPNRIQNLNLPKEKPVNLPAVFNGQLMPGDIDRFQFTAHKGQNLVIETHARSLVPYLADAVPGWLQAAITIYDSQNKEVAFADDFRFDPDPVLFFRVPKTDRYEIQIKDALFRGREDFVYRINIAQKPFITEIFPLGAKIGTDSATAIKGWNLPVTDLKLDTKNTGKKIRQTAYINGRQVSNFVPYMVSDLPECVENQNNDSIKTAQQVTLPIIVNGRIEQPKDTDTFSYQGKAGQKIAAQVYARCLNSPLDSLLKITNSNGKTLAVNDDYQTVDKEYLFSDFTGLVTHHADSYLLFELPEDGTYYVHLSDSQNQGKNACAYRLRISPAIPDFSLKITPSSLFLGAGNTAAIDVYAMRHDGFDGPIELILKNAHEGFKLSGATIPPGSDHIRATLTATRGLSSQPVNLKIAGRAKIKGENLVRDAAPADDMMQAFLYRHLVPSQNLILASKTLPRARSRKMPTFELTDKNPIRISSGDSTKVNISYQVRRNLQKIELRLNQPPEGISITDVALLDQGLTFKLTANDKVKPGFRENLIIDAFAQMKPGPKAKKQGSKPRQFPLGTLPAIPVEIVAN